MHCLSFPRRLASAVRYVLLDRITQLSGTRARAVKCVSLSDDVFADHFPGHPVMPGALLVESLAQLGGVLVEAAMRERGREDLHALLTTIERAKFRRMVRPGDRVELEAEPRAVSEDGGRVDGVARVDGEIAAEAQLTFALTAVSNPRVLERRRRVLNVWLTGSAEEP